MRYLLALVLFLAGPALAGPPIQHWIAPTGARVYFVESRSLPILDVQIDFAAGGARSPADRAGLASLAAALIEAGTPQMNEEQIAARLVDLGAKLSSGSDHDRASVTLRTLATAEEKTGALALLRAVLSTPTFPEAAVNREKTRSIEALRDADTRPDSLVARRFVEAIYAGHPYGRLATPDSVARIDRADLVAFHRSFYVARGAVVSIIGDVSRADAEAIAVHLTEALPPGAPPPPLPPVALPRGETIKLPHPATQSHIRVGLPAIPREDSPDHFALLVGNYILGGGGFVSRLMQEVREKRGFAYSVYSTFAPRVLPGPFEIGLQTKRTQAAEALKVVDAVLAGLLAEGPTDAELAAARKNLIDGQALRIDSNAKLLAHLSLIGFHGLPTDYLDRFPQRVAAVTREDVKTVMRRYLRPAHLVTVIVAAD